MTPPENHHIGSLYHIPAQVYEDENLSGEDILLYALLAALSNNLGYCYASNEWLAKKRNVDERTVRRRLESLENSGYIRNETTKKGMYWDRKIFLNHSRVSKNVCEGSNLSGSSGQNCPDREVRSVHIVREEEIVRKTPPPPPPLATLGSGSGVSPNSVPKKSKKTFDKKERDTHVFLSEEEHQSLLEKLEGNEEKRTLCYKKLSEWKIANPSYAPKSDYLAILKWVCNAVQEQKAKEAQKSFPGDDAIRLVKKVEESFPDKIDKDIIIGYNYVEFRRLPEAHFKFTDHGFKDCVLNCLRKMGLPVQNLLT